MHTPHFTLVARSGSIALIQIDDKESEDLYICTVRKHESRWLPDVVLLGVQDQVPRVFPDTDWSTHPLPIDKMTIDLSSSWAQDIVLKEDELAFQLPDREHGFAIMAYRFVQGMWRVTGIQYQHGIASKIHEDLSFIYCLTNAGILDVHIRLEDPVLLGDEGMGILYEPFGHLPCLEEPGGVARALVDSEEDEITIILETTSGKKRGLVFKRKMH